MAVVPHQNHVTIARTREAQEAGIASLSGDDRMKFHQTLVALAQLCANLRDLVVGDPITKMHVLSSHMDEIEHAYKQAAGLVIFNHEDTARAFAAVMTDDRYAINPGSDGIPPTPESATESILAQVDAPFHLANEDTVAEAAEAHKRGDLEAVEALVRDLAIEWARWVVKRAEDGHSCGQVDDEDHKIIRDLEEERERGQVRA